LSVQQARIFGSTGAAVKAGAFVGAGGGGSGSDPDADQNPNVSGYGKGTTSRRALIIWGASVVWLVLVWRAVEGY